MKTTFRLLALLLLLTPALRAQVPQLLNYQGRVAVNGVNFDGSGQFRFALVNADGTTTYWRNSPDTTPADGVPDSAVTLTVTKGLYSVLLGDTAVANMTALPAGIFDDPVYLRVWFNDGSHSVQLLTPDQRVVAGPAGRAGPPGPQGPSSGADFIYGDGSAGDYTAPSPSPGPIYPTLDVSNPQFVNFAVPVGRTLLVPSGTTIRCTGTFTVDGEIWVEPAGGFESLAVNYVGNQYVPTVILHRGIALTSVGYGTEFSSRARGLPRPQLKAITTVGPIGGGTGGAVVAAYLNLPVGGRGGGSFRVLAKGPIINSGLIWAPGENGVSASSASNPATGGGGGVS